MNLLNNKKAEKRELLITESEALRKAESKLKIKNKESQKKHKEKYILNWREKKEIIDSLNYKGLMNYIDKNKDELDDPRVGTILIKINPYELALIRAAIIKENEKSAKSLMIKNCKLNIDLK